MRHCLLVKSEIQEKTKISKNDLSFVEKKWQWKELHPTFCASYSNFEIINDSIINNIRKKRIVLSHFLFQNMNIFEKKYFANTMRNKSGPSFQRGH
jgi:hypothetical protein